MQASALLLLYALSSWGAALNCPAWARLFVQRLREPRTERWWEDVRLLIRGGLTLLSFGVAGLAGVRLAGAMFDAVPIEVPSPLGVAFIACMAGAEPLFLRVDEVHARAEGRRSIGWRLYWAGTLGGTFMFAVANFMGVWS